MKETMQEKMQQEHDEMLATLNLANSALMRIFGIENTSVGTCDKCNSWDDSLEAGICQTCISLEH